MADGKYYLLTSPYYAENLYNTKFRIKLMIHVTINKRKIIITINIPTLNWGTIPSSTWI